MRQMEKNSLIIWFLLAISISIGSLVYLLVYIYPNIIEIEQDKVNLSNKVEYYNTLISKWFNFKDFKSLNTKYKSDKDIKDILDNWFYKEVYKNLDENFYDNSIYEKSLEDWIIVKVDYESFIWVNNFWEYLNGKLENLNDIIDWKELNDKILKISGVLPKYSSLISLSDEGWLTDLSFINYVERLLKKYNLKINNPIGIKNIIPVENKIIDEGDNIYYIPLNLDITWTKISILNFLKYIQNTGDVEFSNNDFIFSNKLWASSQLSEVSKVEFVEYIDSSFTKRTPFDNILEWFLLKTNQSQDIIEVSVSLKFYVSGLSSEKIRDKIDSIIGANTKQIIFDEDWNYKINEESWEYEYELLHYNYTNLFNIVKKFASNPKVNNNWYYKKKVDNIFSYLNNKDLKKDFATIKKEVSKAKDLDKIYTKVLKYKEIFLKLDKEIYEIAKSLWLEEDRETEDWKTQKSIYPENYYF